LHSRLKLERRVVVHADLVALQAADQTVPGRAKDGLRRIPWRCFAITVEVRREGKTLRGRCWQG
jgi:hypothetical protein